MVILYRTAHTPVVYKTRVCSLATIFRAICFILKFGAPILICFFYVIYSPGNRVDIETPTVLPGGVISFVATTNSTTFVYPPDPSRTDLQTMIVKSIPNFYGDNLQDWTVSIKIPRAESSQISSIAVLFNFTVILNKWASNTVSAIGSFTKSFPSNVNHVSCSGDLVLEQNEIINFRGSFEQTTLEYPSYATFNEILEKEDNLSTLFYVDWEEPIVHYGFWPSFDLELRIRVRDLEIWHSIPLVSSIESVIILYLSTLIFTSIILDTFQGFVFRHGYVKSWAIPLFMEPKKYHGNISSLK
ncbi:hypothetical protein TRFO_08466 [Tritrichomonas foetus]|uniref:Transmembrane protein 231 n=1 Tax=Tritrichomonas foetus TaxID=1144522 RepID=A0A1J4JLD4_9EUKA|nr:hypothetical protein TRFO_08466 [Tritrichomonas foetus]|eukprot:OHS99223.1 hypothetical protein TRFO_08466 [Tritrichomonas foetus]